MSTMRPDPEYIKQLLAAFQDFPEPSLTIEDLTTLGLSYEDRKFYFHLRLLHDQGFVERGDDEAGLGVNVGADSHVEWSVLPLRLTASGHTFAEALNRPAGWEAVKKAGVSASLSLMKDVAVAGMKMELAKHGLLPG